MTEKKLKRGKQGEGGGRKRKYESVQALEMQIQEYYRIAKEREEIPSMSGLAIYLGFYSIQSLLDYEKTPKYGQSIKKARLYLENVLESRLIAGKPPIGLIFALKNRFKWQDKQEMDITSGGETIGVIAMPTR